MLRKAMFAALCIAVVMAFTACADILGNQKENIPEPSETIEKLETAVNNMDWDSVLECVDPSVKKIFDLLPEFSLEALGNIPGVDFDFSDIGDKIPKITIETVDTEYISDTKAVLTVEITIKTEESELSEREDFTLNLKDGKWYIEIPRDMLKGIIN